MQRALFLLLVALAGCRTPPLDPSAGDLAPVAVDLAAAPDLTLTDCSTVPCGAGEVCVFFGRGDCSRWSCEPLPSMCANDPTCACVGSTFCAGLAMTGETLTCVPTPASMPANTIDCMSTILCI